MITTRECRSIAATPLHALLDQLAAGNPRGLACRFLSDGETAEQLLSYKELADRARGIAAGLLLKGAAGKPVLLMHPPGLGFIEGLFACWYASAIAVPVYPPQGGRHRRRLHAVLADSGAQLSLAPRGVHDIPGVTSLDSDFLITTHDVLTGKATVTQSPCLLQYTSGSTAEPKGVMISHENIRSHFTALGCFDKLGFKSVLSWLPPYHDMGLILKILYALEAGIPFTLFSPEHFIQRPVRWLRAISHYRAELSGAPNFAFEMCLRNIRDEELEGLDLSCWKAAPCGAERVRPETIDRFTRRFAPYGFRPEAFLPAYGLAEATLSLTVSPANEKPRIRQHRQAGKIVSCGRPLANVSLRVVDPASLQNLNDGEIGEILVRGPMIAQGYWNRPEASRETFGPDDDRELRTGDLGFLEDGQLYVTGRIKDLIVIDGTNHSPEDIETAAFSSAREITAAAAFAVETDGRETLVLALEARGISRDQAAGLCRSVRTQVSEAHEIPVRRVILVKSGLLPRTTSGKIRRSACRETFEQGKLPFLSDDDRFISTHAISSEALKILLDSVAEVSGMKSPEPEDDLISLGMNSMETTRLAALLQERCGVAVSLGELFSARSFNEVAAILSTRGKATPVLPAIIPGAGKHSNVLTHSQERMWFLHQLDPQSAAYHVFGALEMTGVLDVRSLKQAVRHVISRHSILRSRHGARNGQALVSIVDDCPLPIEIQDAPNDKELRHMLARFAQKPFVLAEESAIRVCLIACGGNRHILAISAHHIVADGWSMRILAKEISVTYAACQNGESCPDFPHRPDYQDYAVCHRNWIESGAVDTQIAYWKSILAGHTGVSPLVTDFPRSANPSSAGGSVERALPAHRCNQVAALAKTRRCTPFMVHLAVFLLLLRRHGAGDAPVVAVPVANRNHSAGGEIIGTLVNTLPFRLAADPDETFASLLERVREASFGMQANQDAPFEKIIDAVRPERSQGHSPLTQVMFDHQEIPVAESWADGLACHPFITHRGAAQFDLSLLLTVHSDRQQLCIEYRSDLFLPETANALFERYLEILQAVCQDPCRKLESITGLTHSDHTHLERISHGPARPEFTGQTTLTLIQNRAARHPGRPAISACGETLDYQTLQARSDRLASALRSRGVKPGDRIAILLERDANLPVALLATWKAGAAYIPLDSANPTRRLQLILEDQAPVHILTSTNLAGGLPPDTLTILLDERLFENPPPLTPHPVSPSDTAYVIYTSGSTGKPKGVVISHGALANFLLSMAETPGFSEVDRLLAVTTVSFDISALEIFLPLIAGGNLELVPTETARDGAALLDLLQKSAATVMQATPATWRLLIDAGWKGTPDLKILCGGEALDLPLASQLRRMGCEVWNLYGPTETTIWSTLWQVPEFPDSIRIGTPIANTGIHILAADGAPLPPGIPGQLWISGEGLADAYWKRPDLDSEKFHAPSPGPRRYHTGDLARWAPDGTLVFLGRSDNQVKIRGFRVELGEIEAVLSTHPHVSQAGVACRGTDPSSLKLVAWVTLHPDSGPFDIAGLRTLCSTRLPAYMLPSSIGVIGAFPLNSNGKVDLTTLADPESPLIPSRPLTHTEQRLAGIWSDLLEIPEIHPDDDWFDIGGHSLLTLRLFAGIHREFQRSLPLSTILKHTRMEDLARKIYATPADQASAPK